MFVDDIIISGSDDILIQKLQRLYFVFLMKNFGRLTYILDLEVNSAPHGIFLNQYEYIKDLIRLANSSEAFSVDTPLEVNVKYLKDKVDILPKLIFFQNLL